MPTNNELLLKYKVERSILMSKVGNIILTEGFPVGKSVLQYFRLEVLG